MKRREFITLVGSAVTAPPMLWPLAARAQQAMQQAIPVVGFLGGNSFNNQRLRLLAFHQGLKESSYIDGQNLAIEYRWADFHNERLPAMAADLVARRVAVIVAQGNYAVLAAKAATSTIPIVFVGGFDPVGIGVVPSLSHPGGNVTGASFLANALETKRLGLIRVLVPRATVIGALINPENASATTQEKDLREAASALGLQLSVGYARNEGDFEQVFTDFAREGVGALVVATEGFFTSEMERLVPLSARHAIPTIYHSLEFAAVGGLMGYASRSEHADRQAGIYVGRILKGEKPGDLPVVLPSKFELVINLKTAKALGLTVPDGLLLAADEVIE